MSGCVMNAPRLVLLCVCVCVCVVCVCVCVCEKFIGVWLFGNYLELLGTW